MVVFAYRNIHTYMVFIESTNILGKNTIDCIRNGFLNANSSMAFYHLVDVIRNLLWIDQNITYAISIQE